MFTSVRRQRQASRTMPAINIAPLIDVVFILLIFFLVTSTFVRDRGVEVTRPQAAAAQTLEPLSLRVSITAAGTIYVDGQPIEVAQLRDRAAGYARTADRPSAVLIPDEQTSSGRLIEVLDAVKTAGVQDIAVATRERQQ